MLLMHQVLAGRISLNASQIRQSDLYSPAGDGTIDISDLALLEALLLLP